MHVRAPTLSLFGGHAQTLTNGWDQATSLALHTTNVFTFYATNNDTLVLRAGSPSFRPLLSLRAPNGASLGVSSGDGSSARAAHLSVTAATSGTFTVELSSYYGNASGDLTLSLARMPGSFVIAPGDEGGPLTNGAANMGAMPLGDLDVWTFAAAANDGIVVRMGATGFRPLISLYGPDGELVESAAGAGSGDTDAYLLASAGAAGTYTVVAQSYYFNGNGDYTLSLAKVPGAFVVSPGDQGGVLPNGAATQGDLFKGDLELYTFDAKNGDNLLVRVGSSGYRPWVRLYGPTGILIGNGVGATSGDRDALIATMATNSGAFTVVVQSYYYNNSGPYTLSLARVPATFITSPGDEGGILTSGAAHGGTNSLGDLDMWSFSANAGDNIALRVGASDFRPELRLYGPDGKLLQTANGAGSASRDAAIFIQATNIGVFTVVEQSYSYGGAGRYTLNFGLFPGVFTVSPGDEGGVLTNAVSRDGVLSLGDLDLWSLQACKSCPIMVTCEKLDGAFTPRIRLYGRNGALLASAQNASLASLSYAGADSGTYTVLVDGAGANDNGSYRLTAYGIYEDGLRLCPPFASGTNLNFSGFGGPAGGSFVLLTTTNIPTGVWTPIATNQFDAYGAFDRTNRLNPSEVQRYYRLRQE